MEGRDEPFINLLSEEAEGNFKIITPPVKHPNSTINRHMNSKPVIF